MRAARIRHLAEELVQLVALRRRVLRVDYDEVYEKAGRTGSWYVTVARKIESDKADAVRAFKTEHDLRGVRLEPDTKRYYPNSSLACHLIGFVGTDNYGLEGMCLGMCFGTALSSCHFSGTRV